MIVFAACVLGLGLGLFGINYWHATKCSSDRSPDEIEDMVIALKNRLLESESKVSKNVLDDHHLTMNRKIYHNKLGAFLVQVLKNEIMMNKLIASMQANLYKLEQIEYNDLTLRANNEAVEIALMLAAHPAPPMPVFPLDPAYLNAENLANAIDDLFAKDNPVDLDYYAAGEGSKNSKDLNEFLDFEKPPEEEAPAITDAEAVTKCTEWKDKYNVIVGASWGDLPYDLQQKWLEYSCDYHMKDGADFA